MSTQEAGSTRVRVSRLIALLRGHRQVQKLQGSRLWRVTPSGCRLISAALAFRLHGVPEALKAA